MCHSIIREPTYTSRPIEGENTRLENTKTKFDVDWIGDGKKFFFKAVSSKLAGKAAQGAVLGAAYAVFAAVSRTAASAARSSSLSEPFPPEALTSIASGVLLEGVAGAISAAVDATFAETAFYPSKFIPQQLKGVHRVTAEAVASALAGLVSGGVSRGVMGMLSGGLSGVFAGAQSGAGSEALSGATLKALSEIRAVILAKIEETPRTTEERLAFLSQLDQTIAAKRLRPADIIDGGPASGENEALPDTLGGRLGYIERIEEALALNKAINVDRFLF